ncbi:MAG: HNH endonuclease, partial [Candidatus Dormibacteraeota bacterium]|nr:HNH endonuclease [Candidatus Dormibacteraeota bacterium]
MEGPLCNDPADEPEAHALCELAAHIHAATAEFSERVAAFDLRNAWGGAGIRSCAHWLSIYAGFDFPTGRGLIAVGAALGALPLTRAAFRTGELSLDKARALASVATAADEEGWVELGRELTAGQLSRICRLYRQAR